MSRIRVGALGVAVMIAGTVGAQTFNEPKFFMWGDPPSGYTGTDPNVFRAVQVNMLFPPAMPDGGGWDARNNPDKVARAVAWQILNDFNASPPRMSADHICVVLQNFGQDSEECDDVNPATGHDNDYPTYAFSYADRLFSDSLFVLPDPGSRTDRAFRHPFFRNASATGYLSDGVTWAAPMKQWMQVFVNTYKQIQANPTLVGSEFAGKTLRDPERFYFDTEAVVAAPPDVNPMWMLAHIYLNEPTLWNSTQVPGQSPGVTLASLYSAAVSQYGWPSQLINPSDPDGTSGVGLARRKMAIDKQNIPFAIWWMNITLAAQDAMMNNCAYDVVRSAWPHANDPNTPKTLPPPVCGNYNDQRADAAMDDTFGWMQDRPAGDNTLNYPRDYTTPVKTRHFPRVHQQTQWSGYNLWGSGNATIGFQRWLGNSQWASGDVDSPFTYRLDDNGYLNHKQKALYRRPHATNPVYDMESRDEMELRLHRQNIEASINSNGGMHSDRLVPWIEMSGTAENGADIPGFRPEREIRAKLSMLRAKNIREGLFWVNWTGRTSDAARAWLTTTKVVHEVYAPRVDGWTVLAGTPASGLPSSSSDPTHTSRLEFTLRDSSGADRTVDMDSTTTGGTKRTELEVEFRDVPTLSGYLSGLGLNITIETSTDKPNMQGQVYAWAYYATPPQWVRIPAQDYDLVNPPTFPTPTPLHYSAHTPDYSVRHTINYGDYSGFVDNGHLKLKLVHLNSQTFTSKYDLVQIVGYLWTGSNPQGLMAGGEQTLIADVNYDGVVDGGDLDQYFEEWLEGVPSTDLNADRSVEEGDLDQFLEAYVTGT